MNGICTNCKESCKVELIDFGIGSYEYWGAPGYDINIQAVSNCCEALVINSHKNIITVKDVKNYYKDEEL